MRKNAPIKKQTITLAVAQGILRLTFIPVKTLYQNRKPKTAWWFLLYPSSGRPSGEFTQACWATDDIEAEIADLKASGVVFEEYDLPNFKTVNSIAPTADNRAAWFKDSEGNLLGIVQLL